MRTLRVINSTGVSLLGDKEDRIKDLRVYLESGTVQFWVELADGQQYLQYMTALEAMTFAQTFDRLAVEALREEGRYIAPKS